MVFNRTMNAVPGAVALAGVDERVGFIRRTYAHLGGAIAAFVLLEYLLFQMPLHKQLVAAMAGTRYGWLVVLGLFMVAGWLAEKWARSDVSPGLQYMGLGLYVIAQAIIFLPLLYVAAYYSDPSVIPTAALLTLTVFAGLTGTVFITRKDFTFLGKALSLGGFAALGIIVAGILFGFSLGLWFSAAMVLLAAGYVLYYTSGVLYHYRTHQHVAAALALFAAIALLFWYILRLVMALSSRD
jgi:FtsH-binding integral membrane protein